MVYQFRTEGIHMDAQNKWDSVKKFFEKIGKNDKNCFFRGFFCKFPAKSSLNFFTKRKQSAIIYVAIFCLSK